MTITRQVKTIKVVEHWIIGVNISDLNDIPQYSTTFSESMFDKYNNGSTIIVAVGEIKKISALLYRREIVYAQKSWDTSKIV